MQERIRQLTLVINHYMCSFQSHSSECPYKDMSCTECHDMILRKDLDHHKNDECRFRSVQCQYCEKSFTAQSLQVSYTAIDISEGPKKIFLID